MKVFITNGTLDYLKKIQSEHQERDILLMEETDQALAYYEGDDDSIFKNARTYEVVDAKGKLLENGFVVMNNIPVTNEGRPIFEDRFKNRAGSIESMNGFQAIRVLRPTDGNTYVVLTQWKDEQSFMDWKNSESFQASHKRSPEEKGENSFFAGPPYITQYHMA